MIINLQKQHKLYNKDSQSDGFGIGYKGCGRGFLKKDLKERAIYCEDINADEFMALRNNINYEFGMYSCWEFVPLCEEIRGTKIALFIAKYYATGQYDESRDHNYEED